MMKTLSVQYVIICLFVCKLGAIAYIHILGAWRTVASDSILYGVAQHRTGPTYYTYACGGVFLEYVL